MIWRWRIDPSNDAMRAPNPPRASRALDMRELDAETLAKYAYLWDGSDPGWVVRGHYQHQQAVRILLPEQGVDSHFLKTLRGLLPGMAHESPGSLRARLIATGCLDCGILESRDVHDLRQKCAKAGLRMETRDRSLIRHWLVNERRNSTLHIEDDALVFMLGEEALRRGVPSRHSTN
jgi:hypothetical protein